MKKGIALVSLVIVVLIISIITGTVALNAYSSIQNAKITDFAREIKTVEDFLTSYVNDNNGEVPTLGTVRFSNEKALENFPGEVTSNGQMIELLKIDLDKIGLVSLNRGNGDEGTLDVYAYSTKTNRVYYPKGVLGNYYLNDNLMKKTGIDNPDFDTLTMKMQDGILVESTKSTNEWLNKLYQIYVSVPKFTGKPQPVVTTSAEATFTLHSQTANYYRYMITPKAPLRPFSVYVDYTNEKNEVKTFIYNVDKIDTAQPTFEKINLNKKYVQGKAVYTITNIKASDALSGISKVKYTNKKVLQQDAKMYFDKEGFDVKNNTVVVDSSKDNYTTFYAEDRAGNYVVYHMAQDRLGEPILTSDMTPIKWVSKNQYNPTEEDETVTTEDDPDWYDYDRKIWANAKTPDGSYWVWIPRFEYKMIYYTSSTKTTVTNSVTKYGDVKANIIDVTKTYPSNGYKIHPAFTNGTKNGFKNGEWDEEIEGFWVSKFEAGKRYGNKDSLVFAPHLFNTHKDEKVGTLYTRALNYDRKNESHMPKNSEWGAVGLFAYSKYGREGKTVFARHVNQTGGDDFAYHTSSTTSDNVYGVLDLAVMEQEYTASYIDMDIEAKNLYGGDMTREGKSTKYVTIYPYNTTNNTAATNFEVLKSKKDEYYGDGMAEVAPNTGMQTAFNDTNMYYPGIFDNPSTSEHREDMFFAKGNTGGYTGQFSTIGKSGEKGTNFRVILIPKRI